MKLKDGFITQDAIVDRMCAKYDAPRAAIAADVAEIVKTLRGIGAVEDGA